ncbi:MAG: hypothetical protein J5I93_15095 [Pirellulaceae bacterium]|nr:hypothetical protein [Pirellulaceae bacterium]
MIETLRQQILDSSSARLLIRQVAEDVLQGHSVWLLHPAGRDARAIELGLQYEFHARHIAYHNLDVRELEGDPPRCLCRHFETDAGRNGRSPLDSVLDALPDIDVVQLTGLDQLPLATQRRWVETAKIWGRTCQSRQGESPRPAALCCVTSLAPELLTDIDGDVSFKLAWWWGVPSGLELRLLLRRLDSDEATRTECEWREHVGAALASGDELFAEHIWPELTSTIERLRAESRAYAIQRGWTAAQVKAAGLSNGFRHHATSNPLEAVEPPAANRRWWNDCLVHFSWEYGCQWHTAGLALLDDTQFFDSRLCRAQAALVLPRLDEVRHQMCHILTEKHGRKWPYCWCEPAAPEEREEIRQSPYACQWGHLRHLLLKVPALRSERRFEPLATQGWKLRNSLAHARPVEYDAFAELCSLAERAF